MPQKTFLDDPFYQKPFCSQTELSNHWKVSKGTVYDYEKNGVISRIEDFDLKQDKVYYSVKEIMQIEGLVGDDIREMDFRRTIKERDELKERCEKLENILAKFRNLAVMEVV